MSQEVPAMTDGGPLIILGVEYKFGPDPKSPPVILWKGSYVPYNQWKDELVAELTVAKRNPRRGGVYIPLHMVDKVGENPKLPIQCQ